MNHRTGPGFYAFTFPASTVRSATPNKIVRRPRSTSSNGYSYIRFYPAFVLKEYFNPTFEFVNRAKLS